MTWDRPDTVPSGGRSSTRSPVRSSVRDVRSSSTVWHGLPRSRVVRQQPEARRQRLVVIETYCSDLELHRSRIEGRRRLIPDWYELDWSHVERSIATWEQPRHVDLRLDAAKTLAENEALLHDLLRFGP